VVELKFFKNKVLGQTGKQSKIFILRSPPKSCFAYSFKKVSLEAFFKWDYNKTNEFSN